MPRTWDPLDSTQGQECIENMQLLLDIRGQWRGAQRRDPRRVAPSSDKQSTKNIRPKTYFNCVLCNRTLKGARDIDNGKETGEEKKERKIRESILRTLAQHHLTPQTKI